MVQRSSSRPFHETQHDLAFPDRKLRRPNFPHISLCKFPHPLERSLQFRMKSFFFGIICIHRNWNLRTHPHQCPRKRLRNHRSVPGVQNPGSLHCDMKHHHRYSRGARQHNRPRLGYVSRTAWAIDGKSDRPALLEFPAHAQKCAHGSSTLRSAHFHEAKFPHNAPHPFPIKAIAAHDPDLQVPPKIHRWDDAAVPKRVNDGPSFESRRRAIFEGRRKTQCRAYQPHDQDSRPGDQPQQESLPQGIRPRLGRCLARDRRCGCCAHSRIVPAGIVEWTLLSAAVVSAFVEGIV
jgi:hypothetical protein